MWQEVVSHKEAQKHEVVDNSLQIEIKSSWELDVFELKVQVFSDDSYLHELELDSLRLLDFVRIFEVLVATFMRQMAHLVASSALFVLFLCDRLSQNEEVRLVGAQAKHDQIGVGPVDAVRSIRIIAHLGSL